MCNYKYLKMSYEEAPTVTTEVLAVTCVMNLRVTLVLFLILRVYWFIDSFM